MIAPTRDRSTNTHTDTSRVSRLNEALRPTKNYQNGAGSLGNESEETRLGFLADAGSSPRGSHARDPDRKLWHDLLGRSAHIFGTMRRNQGAWRRCELDVVSLLTIFISPMACPRLGVTKILAQVRFFSLLALVFLIVYVHSTRALCIFIAIVAPSGTRRDLI